MFLFDGMALAYRAYFAFINRPLMNSKGENTSAIYGFVSFLNKVLDEEHPDHIAVVFDTKEPTFRHVKYPQYKATREKMPDDMSSQMEKLKDVVRAYNIPLLEVPGYEADDIMGTLARRAEKEGVLTYLVTGDKDFMQLISPLIKMYRPGKMGNDLEIVAENEVTEKFGVQPDRVIDVLALTGDKSDNVPGVPGIGEKTAIPLIQRFGSLDEVYTHLDDIEQKGTREKLKTHRDLAFLSKELVTIHTEVPLDINFHTLRAAKKDIEKLTTLFTALEFRTLVRKLKEAPQEDQTLVFEAPKPLLDNTSDRHQYKIISNGPDLIALCKQLSQQALLCIDTETTSTDAMIAELVGVSLAVAEREAVFIPVGIGGIPLSSLKNHLGPVLENPSIKKIGQNIKYDALVLAQHGMRVNRIAFDTMVASYVIRPDGKHNLDALAEEYLSYKMISYDDLVGTGKSRVDIRQVPLERLATYAAEDADFTLRLFPVLQERLEKQSMTKLCEEIEFPLIPVLTEMELTGVRLDVPFLAYMSKDLERQLDQLVHRIYEQAGEEFNINSTQQLGVILFEKLKLPTVRKTKTGFSTDVQVLESLRLAHPIVELMLEYRTLTKLKSTYIDALPKLIHPGTGRVHTSFNQTIAATGRLSSSDPNLQNIPIRTEMGREIRKAFIPGSENMVIMSADYSQIELRVMAHMSDDPGLQEAFRNREDIHASTAAKVFGVEQAEITRDMRRKAKEVNFGIMYGIGPYGLATRLEISQSEAREIIDRYFVRFPKVSQYIHDTKNFARQRGYVETLSGRRRYLPNINNKNRTVREFEERAAINMPIQGTAADMIKRAMIEIHQRMINGALQSKMLLQVHDELVFEVPTSEERQMRALVEECMKTTQLLSVPLEIEIGVGKNWLEAH
ncbi:MAG: DNA polymerase I [Bacteroidota bacterium]